MKKAIALLIVFLSTYISNPSLRAGMLDSLDKATFDSALVLLNIDPSELGFDKLWAADDTFRLAVVEEYLNDPVAFPGYVDETKAVVDSFAFKPLELLAFMSEQLQVDPEADPIKIPEYESPEFDPANPYGIWIDAIATAEPYLKGFYAQLDSMELQDLITAGPGLWNEEEEDSLKKELLGAWNREFGIEYDSTANTDSDHLLDIIKKLDMNSLLKAGMIVVPAAQTLVRAVADQDFSSFKTIEGVEKVQGEVLYYSETKWGKFIIGGTGDNTYYGNFDAIIDIGGNDVYRGRCGGAIGELSQPYSLVIDLEGDDLYDSQGKDVAHGAGFLGIGVVVDGDGDDTYRSNAYSQGAGLFGIGFHVDHNGADDRRGGYFMQGAGHCGIGILIDTGDDKSDDRYLSSCWSQGFAGTFGYGLLFDDGGDDTYKAGGTYFHAPLLPHDYRSFSAGFGMGWRPRAGGGIGVIYDKGDGNDFYDQEVMSIGSSYWYSIGIAIDEGGNDSYNLAHYGMGVGIHLSLGALYEMGGDDQYHSRHGVVGATAHDFSVGLMVDSEGDDYYIVGDGWGGSLTNSYGLFIDKQGNDTYATRGGSGYSFGKARWARGFAGAAVFLDLEGTDVYPKGVSARDSSIWIQTGWGIGMDLPREVKTEKEAPIGEITLTAEDSAKSIEELYQMASQWEVGSAREEVARGRKALLERGIEVVEYIINGPDSLSPNNISNLKIFAKKINKPTDEVSEFVSKNLANTTREDIKNYLQISDDVADSTVKVLEDSLKVSLTKDLNTLLQNEDFYNKNRFKHIKLHPDLVKDLKRKLTARELFHRNWHLFEQAFPKEIEYNSGRLHSRSGIEYRLLEQIIKALPDSSGKLLFEEMPIALEMESPYVMSNIISLLGGIKYEPAVEEFLEILSNKDHKKFWNSCISNLGKMEDKRAVEPIEEFLDSDLEKRRILSIGALGGLMDSTSIPGIVKMLDDEEFTIRSIAMMTVAKFGPEAIPFLKDYLNNTKSLHPESALYSIGRVALNLKDSTDVISQKVRFETIIFLEKYLTNPNPFLRAESVTGLYRVGGEKTRAMVDRYMEIEFNPVVLAAHERMVRELLK